MRAENLSLSYGSDPVINELTLAINPGELTVLIGVNGCGKTSLLRALAGLHKPLSGAVYGAAQKKPQARRYDLAYLPQTLPERASLSVSELVLMGADAPNRWYPSPDAKERAKLALELLGMTTLAERACDTLSGGEYRRAALAACFAQGTPWLLLDEPCAGLDLHQAAVLMNGLSKWLKNDAKRGALVVLHDLNLCAQWADRCVLLNNGQIEADGDPETVLSSTALEAAYGQLQRFRHPQRDHLVVLGPQQ